tara:strand:+ start:4247 stop:4969 length:723 start_codon:yes stop_codon:yes gene_type:complete
MNNTKPQKLLNAGNSKTVKGEKLGWMTFGLHLAPFNLSGKNVCANASAGCAAACLNTAGRGAMSNVQNARIAKTQNFFADRTAFTWQLAKEIGNAIKLASKKGMKPCFRLNLTSDLPWENIKVESHGKKLSLLEMYPDVQFYDYTKSFPRMIAYLKSEMPKNYHLTFSRSECNEEKVCMIVKLGGNVAAVFRNKFPKMWKDSEVVNGDETDLRFLDGQNKIVGLLQKGLAKKDSTGFVIG